MPTGPCSRPSVRPEHGFPLLDRRLFLLWPSVPLPHQRFGMPGRDGPLFTSGPGASKPPIAAVVPPVAAVMLQTGVAGNPRIRSGEGHEGDRSAGGADQSSRWQAARLSAAKIGTASAISTALTLSRRQAPRMRTAQMGTDSAIPKMMPRAGVQGILLRLQARGVVGGSAITAAVVGNRAGRTAQQRNKGRMRIVAAPRSAPGNHRGRLPPRSIRFRSRRCRATSMRPPDQRHDRNAGRCLRASGRGLAERAHWHRRAAAARCAPLRRTDRLVPSGCETIWLRPLRPYVPSPGARGAIDGRNIVSPQPEDWHRRPAPHTNQLPAVRFFSCRFRHRVDAPVAAPRRPQLVAFVAYIRASWKTGCSRGNFLLSRQHAVARRLPR